MKQALTLNLKEHSSQQALQIMAQSHLPVLLFGETGVGKEVLAKQLHNVSARRVQPFVVVNCGAITPSLLDSALFGALKGSYTGAHNHQVGLVRSAHMGTLFLDEIGELPLESQSRLLRVLQEKSVLPVGGVKEIPVNFRLICATHRNLLQMVAKGQFREDLYYRISVIPWNIKPLRERRAEIPTLAAQIWKELHREALFLEVQNYCELTLLELQMLQQFNWPGNVRQLRHILERYLLFRELGIRLEDLLQEEATSAHVCEAKMPYLERPSFEKVLFTLNEEQGNKSRAARRLGVSRGALDYRLRMQR